MKKNNRVREEMKQEQKYSSRLGDATNNFSEEEIRRRAYELAEERGFQPGHEVEYWLEAEKTIRNS
jgi:hypothetical protein